MVNRNGGVAAGKIRGAERIDVRYELNSGEKTQMDTSIPINYKQKTS